MHVSAVPRFRMVRCKKAEIRATSCREQVQAIRCMLQCLGVKVTFASLVRGDNLGVMQNFTVPDCLLKKKHVAIACHKSREGDAASLVHPIKISSKNKFSEILTKPANIPFFLVDHGADHKKTNMRGIKRSDKIWI